MSKHTDTFFIEEKEQCCGSSGESGNDPLSASASAAAGEKLQQEAKSSGSEGEKGQDSYPRLRYKGIRRRSWGQWVSEIREPRKRTKIWLGSFPTAEMAARAYDAALLCLRGPNAAFNFADSPLIIHLEPWTSKKDIQAIAATAALRSVRHAAFSISSNAASFSYAAAVPLEEGFDGGHSPYTENSQQIESNAVSNAQPADWSNQVRLEEDPKLTLPDMAQGMLLDPLPPLQFLYDSSHHHEAEKRFDEENANNPLEEVPFWS
ncbi:hypothetical protein O6H91_03G035700 [Diphasiastrum complanatum]|uniref:Uncharacterized protein n=1 Tax=Diphasiastrum complanatum TaxID=34168 RepID=A0ACC2E5B9_DIPCM|nr:hypothetical protein O6H91_03G035700 [Diphasiastrum complanatum]